MPGWIVASVMALLLYGLWGFFPKLAVNHISPQSMLVYEVAGGLAVGIIAVILMKFRIQAQPAGILFSFLTGVAGMLGTLLYFKAASQGKIAVVVSITALYPLVTIVMSMVFLREQLTVKQMWGMATALAAILMMVV